MAKNWNKIGVLGCNSVIPRNVGEPPTGDGTAVGNAASAATAGSVAVGDGAAAHGQKSVAIGSGSIANNDDECSVGEPATESAAEVTREVTHVSEPTAPSSAATKAYVDKINNVAPLSTGTPAKVTQGGQTAVGNGTSVTGTGSVAVGLQSTVTGAYSVALGTGTNVAENQSAAIGRGANTSRDYEVSVGVPERTRFVSNVTNPTLNHDAATKGYVDANTSNTLIGKAFGNPAHVEDAWPSKPLELVIGGAYKQGDTTKPPIEESDDPSPEDQVLMATGTDTSSAGTYGQNGTPTPNNPIPIEVVENPVLRVTGADTSAAGASLPITLPAEHPYLAALPDGTCDKIVIDKDGNATLVAMVGRDTDVREVGDVAVGQYFSLKTTLHPFASADALTSSSALCSALPYLVDSFGVYRTWTGVYVKYSTQEDKDGLQTVIDAAAPMTVFAPIPETRYPIGKLDIPSLPNKISNIWVEGSLATEKLVMEYKQDVNLAVPRSSPSITVENGSAVVNMKNVSDNIAGNGLTVVDGKLNVDTASAEKRGTVRVGSGLAIDSNGVLSATGGEYAKAVKATSRTSETLYGIGSNAADVISYETNVPVFEQYGSLFAPHGYFTRTLKAAYTAGTTLHIECDYVLEGKHIGGVFSNFAIVNINGDVKTLPALSGRYNNWYYWGVNIPIDKDVRSGTSVTINFV